MGGAGRHAVAWPVSPGAAGRGLRREPAWRRAHVLLCDLWQLVVTVLAGRVAAAGPEGEARRGLAGRRQRRGRRRREAPPLRT